MRYVVYGAGAIGGLTGALLSEAAHEVVLIARGVHARAIGQHGLRIESDAGGRIVDLPVVTHPDQARIGADDVVLLCVKSQDTAGALDALRPSAPVRTPIVCLQNGVANELAALRFFSRVYGVHVLIPASHLEPGVVLQSAIPVPGVLDMGRYPRGLDDVVGTVGSAFRSAGIESVDRCEIMRWKYRKLLVNLGNAAEALLHPNDARDIQLLAMAEGEECLRAAGIGVVAAEEDEERRPDYLKTKEYPPGSSWQSLKRQAGSVESDFLNGEIVQCGRLHGVPTPVNEILQELMRAAAVGRVQPGGLSAEEFRTMLTASRESAAEES